VSEGDLQRITREVLARPAAWEQYREGIQRQFDRLASGWEARSRTFHLLEAALDHLEGDRRRILDVGTGTGGSARVLARRFPTAEVVGVDLSPAMIDEARRILPRNLGGRVRYEVADASELPFEDGAFDLVALVNMIVFPEELARVTSSDGSLVVAFLWGAETPIYVPLDHVRDRLSGAGFDSFAEVRAGLGEALIAWRM
jgi:ubiquinone/menaquinone biosynthesis C-methylase UbiE